MRRRRNRYQLQTIVAGDEGLPVERLKPWPSELGQCAWLLRRFGTCFESPWIRRFPGVLKMDAALKLASDVLCPVSFYV